MHAHALHVRPLICRPVSTSGQTCTRLVSVLLVERVPALQEQQCKALTQDPPPHPACPHIPPLSSSPALAQVGVHDMLRFALFTIG